MALTVDQLKLWPGIVGTTVADAVLTSLLAAAYEAIAERVGAVGNVSSWIRRPHGMLLMLPESASAIVSISEGTLALAADDYELRDQTVRRLLTGTHPATVWRDNLDVVWTPATDTNERDRVAAELVKLELAFSPGLVSQQIGPWRETFQEGSGSAEQSYDQQREAILASLGSGVGIR